ncbi:Os08g0517950 [Oryza sativa Japonica Group]|uniref:Os08g0517950 protein n=1 Tax=Oryza sativa subsp. japonica TaxID=39947 RepID=A0A0P0XHW0_ORYSJ|nr:Os08g0517950 [Oryza sativa Japonica Group]
MGFFREMGLVGLTPAILAAFLPPHRRIWTWKELTDLRLPRVWLQLRRRGRPPLLLVGEHREEVALLPRHRLPPHPSAGGAVLPGAPERRRVREKRMEEILYAG